MTQTEGRAMLDGIKAGQTIKCTITGEPRAQDATDTIVRLMRRDPNIKRALARAQRLRRQRMNTYIRGNRTWYSRERCSKIAKVQSGASWEMPFTFDIAPDLQSVGQFVSVEKA
ncbi:MAG: hypothetical protein ACIARR_12630 [Phycisphaerales bacterium JB059]